jgi:hypothetical protein
MEYPDLYRIGNFLLNPDNVITTPIIDVKYGSNHFFYGSPEHGKTGTMQDWVNQIIHFMIMRAKNITMAEAIEIAIREKPPLHVYTKKSSDKTPTVYEYKLIQ